MNWRPLAFYWLIPAILYSAGCSRPPAEPLVGEWRQFRGPAGLGISLEEDLPVSWKDSSSNILWRARVPGSGNSSPVVSGGRVFLTTTFGGPDDGWESALQRKNPSRVVLAYDLESGEQLWATAVFRGPVGRRHWSNTHAAPTPATDGRHLFVSFDAHLAALDFDGNILWHREIDPEYYDYSHYGVSSSPVLAGRALILLQDKEEGSSGDPGWLAAFDKQTGEEIWRDEWTDTCCSYNTPLVVDRDGRLEVWNQTAMEVVGYDARTGKKLWRAEHPTMQTVPSLARRDDLFVTPGGIHSKSLVMFHFCNSDEGASPIQTWSSRNGVPDISSPVFYGDKLFTVTRGGGIYAWSARSGELLWRKRLPAGDYRPSLVAGDGKVYALNDRGVTTVIDATGDEPRILSRNQLSRGSSASPAIAGGSIFIRTDMQLLRIGVRSKSQAQSPDSTQAEADEPTD